MLWTGAMSESSASIRAEVGGGPAANHSAGPPSQSVRNPKALEKELSGLEGRKWLSRLGIVLACVLVAAAVLAWRMKNQPPPPPRYITAKTSRGDVIETVQSTGQVKPLTEVQVGAQVSGRITKVFVDFNSVVKANQVLAEIDPTLFNAQADSSSAQLAAQRAQVARAEANLTTAKVRLDRAKKLVAEGIGTQADVDAAQGGYDVALADLAAAKAQVASIGAQVRSSRTNLEFTKIYSRSTAS
jgi:HlyD family secretion protein